MYLHFLNYIWSTFIILASFMFPFYHYYYFLVKKRKPLFSNPIEVKYLVTVIVYQGESVLFAERAPIPKGIENPEKEELRC